MSLWAYLLPALLLLLEVGFPLGVFVPGGDTLLLALGALVGKEKLSLFPLLPLLFLLPGPWPGVRVGADPGSQTAEAVSGEA